MKVFKNFLFGEQGPLSNKDKPSLSNAEYKKKGFECLELAWDILNSTDGWKLEKQTPEGDTVYSKHLPGYGKIFKLTGEANFPPRRLIKELFNNLEQVPQWNPAVRDTRKVEIIDETTDVSYVLSCEGAGGLVCSRDFVTVRQFGIRDNCYISAGISVTHPSVPPSKKYIRGENGPNCWVTRPLPGVKDRCTFQWLLNTNLHGWIPQYLVDTALTATQLDYMTHLRKYGKKLKEEGKL